ncbi:MAG: hypothetical protein JNK21_11375 [Rhodospirillaceae bacterium]|nr:hypothetical protein [Rhodospirillaceae bacterium]
MTVQDLFGRTSSAVLLALGLTACGSTHIHSSDRDLSFNGLQKLVAVPENASGPVAPARIFVIHGMGFKDRTYVWPLVAALSNRLNLSCGGPGPCVPQLPANPIIIKTAGADGEATLDTYELKSSSPRLRSVEVYALTWAPMTIGIKKKELAEPDIGKRALINKALKEDLMKDGFGDAVLYVGTYGRVMRETVKHALCHFVGGTPKPMPQSETPDCEGIPAKRIITQRADAPGREPVALVSFSLGSMMLYRSLTDLRASPSPSTKAAFDALAASTDSVYMMANQVSLLQLGEWSAARESIGRESTGPVLSSATPPDQAGQTVANEPAAMVLRALRGGAVLRPDGAVRPMATDIFNGRLEVVAFSDPNDLLSFEFPMDDNADARFVNVYSTIAFPWFNALANPLKAHTGHVSDDTVMDFFLCGAKSGEVLSC